MYKKEGYRTAVFSVGAHITTMKFGIVLAALLGSAFGAPIFKKRAWNYDSDKVHGINIGGWLVLEPFITPSLFEAAAGDDGTPPDEYTYDQQLGHDEAQKRLQEHWDTWIVERDFEYMATMGLNLVRIPIGYWAYHLMDGDPYVQGQDAYLERAIGWAANHNLNVWIDLHGAPGSQNGYDNSGRRGSIDWQSSQENIDVTLDVLKTISDKYAGYDNVVGIELLNEPLGIVMDQDRLDDFYTRGYELIRNDSVSMPVILHDAYLGDNHWDPFLNTVSDPEVYNVVVDHHHYNIFSKGELRLTLDEHIENACNWGRNDTEGYHWNLCGEWTAALTDCARWVNGADRGARYDSTFQGGDVLGSCDDLYSLHQDFWEQPDVVERYRRWVEAQMDAFEHGKVGGWIFWCWKTESAVEWDFQRLAGLGVIPQPLDNRRYPNQCGY